MLVSMRKLSVWNRVWVWRRGRTEDFGVFETSHCSRSLFITIGPVIFQLGLSVFAFKRELNKMISKDIFSS